MSFIAHDYVIKTDALFLYLEWSIKGRSIIICKDTIYYWEYTEILIYLPSTIVLKSILFFVSWLSVTRIFF